MVWGCEPGADSQKIRLGKQDGARLCSAIDFRCTGVDRPALEVQVPLCCCRRPCRVRVEAQSLEGAVQSRGRQCSGRGLGVGRWWAAARLPSCAGVGVQDASRAGYKDSKRRRTC